MHQVLEVCAEIPVEVVERYRSGGGHSISIDTAAEPPRFSTASSSSSCMKLKSDTAAAAAEKGCDVSPAVAGAESSGCANHSIEETADVVMALQWSTGVADKGILYALLKSLPEWSLREQVLAYEGRDMQPKKKERRFECKLVVEPHKLMSRWKVSEAYDKYLRSRGWAQGGRAPRHSLSTFVSQHLEWKQELKEKTRCVRRWHREWVKTKNDGGGNKGSGKVGAMAYRGVILSQRQRAHKHQGRPSLMNWVRENLYEWFVQMCYSIDWKKYDAALRSNDNFKAIGRFPFSLLRQKTKQLMHEYCQASLLAGERPAVAGVHTWHWFKRWQMEYGLSLRAPNRKYKVPKAVLEERLRIWWLNLARLRALCAAIHKYDPEMENWDQSPFHHNEIGSQNAKTFAVRGSIEVPLIEGHADVRSRWTANLTTFSDKARRERGHLPYAEVMFKADGEQIQKQLREHIRSRGYDDWVSASTSIKGSYREADILEFLDRHLPPMEESREWRIIMADDFSAHKSPNFAQLCWQ